MEEGEILAGHFQATAVRAAAQESLLLVLHDTTEFVYRREDPAAIGIVKARRLPFRPTLYTSCGILLHSSLAVSTVGLSLGLCDPKFWTRDQFKGTNALKRSVNPTRIPIEEKERIRWIENLDASTKGLGCPDRCVHIGDRLCFALARIVCVAAENSGFPNKCSCFRPKASTSLMCKMRRDKPGGRACPFVSSD